MSGGSGPGEPEVVDGEVPFASIVDLSPIAIYVIEPVRAPGGTITDFRWCYLNEQARAALDRLPADRSRRTMLSAFPEAVETGLYDAFVRVAETGERFKSEAPIDAGPVRGIFRVEADKLGARLIMRFQDITARVRAEAASREASRQVLNTMSRVSDAVYALDADWRFTYVNGEAERLLGRTAAELVGADVWEEFPAAADSPLDHHYRRAVATGSPVEFETYYPAPLDTWFEVRAWPNPSGLTVFFRDVGTRHALEEHAVRMERLESLATMASGIAHDFNNLLMAVDGHARLLEEDLPEGTDAQADARAIREAASRAIVLTRQLSAFTSAQVLRSAVVDLDSTLQRVAPRLEALLGDGCTLDLRLAGAPVLVDADPDELDRALLQLVDNAAWAMAGGGTLLVQVTLVQITADQLRTLPAQSAGWYGVITLADDGVGMEPGVLARAVEPFFSTRRGAGATGLGLSSVHGMANQAGGRLSLYSEPGIGTTVRLYLPRAASDVPSAAAGPAPTADANDVADAADAEGCPAVDGQFDGKETILVVDDNRSVRDLLEQVLGDHGYKVLTAEREGGALDLFADHADEVAVVVSDLVLARSRGEELAARLREQRPDLPVLYVSGKPDGLEAVRAAAEPGTDVLAKPFGPLELLGKVRRLIDRDDAGR